MSERNRKRAGFIYASEKNERGMCEQCVIVSCILGSEGTVPGSRALCVKDFDSIEIFEHWHGLLVVASSQFHPHVWR